MTSEKHTHLSPFHLKDQKPTQNATERIKEMIHSAPIFIFMKGNAEQPQCGFSANTVSIFKKLGKSFKTFDILTDPEIRQTVKEFSNWPTLPQIYVNKKFIGGNDIVTEMYESGELQELVKDL